MNKKTQYCQDVNFSQIDLQIPYNPNKNSSKLFYGYQQTDSIIERQKTQHNTEEEQSWRTDTT